MVTVDELRTQLKDLGVDEEVVESTKGKANLVKLLEEINIKTETNLEEFDFEKLNTVEEVVEEEEVEEKDISYISPEWNDYVLSQFSENELVDGCPNVHGLRRVTEMLLGPVVRSVGTVVNNYTCNYIIMIQWNRDYNGFSGMGDYGVREFSGVASAHPENTDHPYSMYLEANAETRAEVRALRKALRIQTIAAEEVKREHVKQEQETTGFDDTNISTTQIAFIKNKTKDLKINMELFVQTIGKTGVEGLTKEEAAGLIKDLNKYQTNHEPIPENLKEDK